MKTSEKVPDIAPISLSNGFKQRIHQFGLDGHYIGTFESVADAHKELGIKGMGIYRALSGKSKSCAGYQWRKAT